MITRLLVSAVTLLFVICVQLTPTVHADDSLSKGGEGLKHAGALKGMKALTNLNRSAFVDGEFIQRRYLEGFSRPLVSSGVFYFWRKHGLYWEMQKPFFGATTYGQDESISWASDGTVSAVAKSDAFQQQISRVILAMLSADVDLLSTQFNVDVLQRELGWGVQLQPKVAAVAQVIERIAVFGDSYLQRIELVAANGDRTEIDFVVVTESIMPPAEKCLQFFTGAGQGCE